MTSPHILLSAVAIHLTLVALLVFGIRAWVRRQPDILIAQYKLSNFAVAALPSLAIIILGAHFLFPKAFSVGYTEGALLPIVLLSIALTIRARLRRKLLERK